MSRVLAVAASLGALLVVPALTLLALLTVTGAALACTSTPASSAAPAHAGRDSVVTEATGRPRTPPPSSTTTATTASPTSTVAAAVSGSPVLLVDPACSQTTGTGAIGTLPGGPAPVTAAITRALSYVGLTTGYAHHCDRLACRAYNYANSGYASATAHWQAMLATGHAHPGDRCPPAGSFVYWATRDAAGHVAFVARADPGCDPARILLVSNDVGDAATGHAGGVYLVSLARIQSGFVTAAGYRGWSDPVCAGALLPPGTHHPLPS